MDYTTLLKERKKVKDEIFTLERKTPDSERQEYKDFRMVIKDGDFVVEEHTYLSTPAIETLRKKDTFLKMHMNGVSVDRGDNSCRLKEIHNEIEKLSLELSNLKLNTPKSYMIPKKISCFQRINGKTQFVEMDILTTPEIEDCKSKIKALYKERNKL